MTLALCIPFRGANAPDPRFLGHLARQIARLTFFDDPLDRPDFIVIGHMAKSDLDDPALVKRLPKAVGKHPTGSHEPEIFVSTLISPDAWSPAVARNIAAVKAIDLGADQLVFCDADVLQARGAFFVAREKLLERCFMVTRPWLIGETSADALVVERLWPRLPPAVRYSDPLMQNLYVPGAFFAIPAGLFVELGGYCEEIGRGEDEDICDRAVRLGATRLLHETLALHVGAVTKPETDPLLPKAREILDFRRANGVAVVRNPSGRFAAPEDRRRVLPPHASARRPDGPSPEV